MLASFLRRDFDMRPEQTIKGKGKRKQISSNREYISHRIRTRGSGAPFASNWSDISTCILENNFNIRTHREKLNFSIDQEVNKTDVDECLSKFLELNKVYSNNDPFNIAHFYCVNIRQN